MQTTTEHTEQMEGRLEVAWIGFRVFRGLKTSEVDRRLDRSHYRGSWQPAYSRRVAAHPLAHALKSCRCKIRDFLDWGFECFGSGPIDTLGGGRIRTNRVIF